jgi:hypothetical protein
LVASCATPSEKISGTYTGQYTNNTIILTGIKTTITKEGDKTVSVTFDATGTAITVSGVNIVENENSFALTKVDFLGAFSGAVEGNELNVGYSSIAGAISFVGTK